MKLMKWSLAAGFALGLAVSAPTRVEAQAFSGPLPANVYIQFGGLDWAWASPCLIGLGPNGCGGGPNDFVLVDGFRFASASEWAARPDPSAFLDPSGAVRCASGWFSVNPAYTHCDYSDAVNGYLASGPGNFASQGANPFDESWVVRGGATVPEPASMGLVGVGLALVGVAARRRRQA